MTFYKSICYNQDIAFQDYFNKINIFNNEVISKCRDDILRYHLDIFSGKESIVLNKNYIYRCVDSILNDKGGSEQSISDLLSSLAALRDVVEHFDEIQIENINNSKKRKIFMFISELIYIIEPLITSFNDRISGYNENLQKTITDHLIKLNARIDSLNLAIIAQDKAIKEEDKKLNDQKSDIITHMITVVSIFVAISVVMFGGMNLLTGLLNFSNMKEVPLLELLSLGSLIGIIMVSVMYCFILFVLRIIDKIEGNKLPYQTTYYCICGMLAALCIVTTVIWLVRHNM